MELFVLILLVLGFVAFIKIAWNIFTALLPIAASIIGVILTVLGMLFCVFVFGPLVLFAALAIYGIYVLIKPSTT